MTQINNKIATGADGLPPAVLLGTANMIAGSEEAALQGKYRLVYLTPEKLASGGFIDRLKLLADRGAISLLAVDEAHCLSEWGHDFRVDYARIGAFRDAIPGVPICALTATAVMRVRSDIVNSLRMRDPLISTSTLDRPNLRISCARKVRPRVRLRNTHSLTHD